MSPSEGLRRLRVLHLTSSAGFYGAERVIVQLVRHLEPWGVDSMVATLGKKGSSSQQIVQVVEEMGRKGVFIPCRGRLDRAALAQLVDLIKTENIDIVHCHEPKSRIYAAFAVRRAPVPLVATNHNWTRQDVVTTAVEWLDAIALRFFDRIVAVSRPVAAEMAKFGLSRSKVVMIPNGVTAPEPASRDGGAVRKSWGIAAGAPVVGSVGRLDENKSLDTLLAAARKVLEVIPDTVFLIVGDGPARRELESYAREAGIADNVIFTGFHPNVGEFYAEMNVFALTSKREGTPMVVLEAMAAGVPVVSTAVGGVVDLIRDGETGILLLANDPLLTAQAIVRLLEEPEAAGAIAGAASAMVENEYGAQRMARDYSEVYRACAGAERVPAPPEEVGNAVG